MNQPRRLPNLGDFPHEETIRPMGGRKSFTMWGDGKTQRTMSLTGTCWHNLTEYAQENGYNRSELIEIISRALHLIPFKELRANMRKNYNLKIDEDLDVTIDPSKLKP